MSTTATAPADAHGHGQPHMTLRDYLIVYAALLGLMLLTLIVAYFFDLGPANFIVAMAIAVTKMVLIILYFMHVRFNDKLTWVFSTAAFLWLVILIVGFLDDYFTRGSIADK
jgi:cytochrome c oxidase subunit 4